MKLIEFKRAIKNVPDEDNFIVLIQLPDNEPPVSFSIERFEDTLILFPIPNYEGHKWDHETNVNMSSPWLGPEYAAALDEHIK